MASQLANAEISLKKLLIPRRVRPGLLREQIGRESRRGQAGPRRHRVASDPTGTLHLTFDGPGPLVVVCTPSRSRRAPSADWGRAQPRSY